MQSMALVPFRVSGPAADQASDVRLFQLPGGHCLFIRQCLKGSAASRPHLPQHAEGLADVEEPDFQQGQHQSPQPIVSLLLQTQSLSLHGNTAAARVTKGIAPATAEPPLHNVGFVVWQSAFVLSEYLLRWPPFGSWPDVRSIDLGTGTGVVGIALALAGSRTVLTDLPHCLPLAEANVADNCVGCPTSHAPVVLPYRWGEEVDALRTALGGCLPDLITGADVIFEPASHLDLIAGLKALSAPHTVTFLSYRMRRSGEEAFVPRAEAAGFAVERVPPSMLHDEYQAGDYHILRLTLMDAMES